MSFESLSDHFTINRYNSFPVNSDLNATSSDVESLNKKETPWTPSRPEWMAMITMAVSSLVVALDATILVSVLPTLAVDLNVPSSRVFWAGTSYLLANAVVQPFIAAVSDIFGRRELIIPSIFLFTVASIICGVAQSFTTLIVGRVLQGISGGGIMTLSQLVFADIVPLRQRPKYFATVLASYAVGVAFGPLIGGSFTQKVSWRWCFYINLPICGIGFVMSILFVKLKREHVSLRTKLASIDWTGGFLFISSLTTFLIAISWGGVQFAWTSWHTLFPLVLGAVGFMASMVWERYYAQNPFLNRSLFSETSSIIAYITALLQGLVLFLVLYFTSFYFATVKLHRPIAVGIDLFPAVLLFTPAAIIVSALITRTGLYRWSLIVGWTFTLVGSGLLNLWDVHTSTAIWIPTLCIVGFGLGVLLSGINWAIQAIVSAEDAGRAAGMYAFMRSLGFSIAVAIGGTIFQNQMSSKLSQLRLPASIAENAEAFAQVTLRSLSENDPLRQNVLKAYVHGFRGIWITMTAFSAVALLLSLTVKKFSLDKGVSNRYSMLSPPSISTLGDHEEPKERPVSTASSITAEMPILVPEQMPTQPPACYLSRSTSYSSKRTSSLSFKADESEKIDEFVVEEAKAIPFWKQVTV